MYLMVIYVVCGIVFLWLIVITFILWKVRAHYNNLVSATKKDKIDDILDSLIAGDKRNEIEITKIQEALQGQINESKLHLKKIGLVRFNPFERVGGEQSFVVSLLNEENDGIILNFIYTKEGLRVYTKRIRKSKGEEYELSEEEKKSIERSG